ncbi:hypothetical protein BB559_004394 [Furculomyces boomerangus]|uniref:MHD domain-containing protein n=1 Tax=Furculomyces boomerangus TaxID=61424 RepID=A0A2T9YEY3_9FUNG|nr:hypothetical protein BB559_004394 [Furculomyces boomerangus]
MTKKKLGKAAKSTPEIKRIQKKQLISSKLSPIPRKNIDVIIDIPSPRKNYSNDSDIYTDELLSGINHTHKVLNTPRSESRSVSKNDNPSSVSSFRRNTRLNPTASESIHRRTTITINSERMKSFVSGRNATDLASNTTRPKTPTKSNKQVSVNIAAKNNDLSIARKVSADVASEWLKELKVLNKSISNSSKAQKDYEKIKKKVNDTSSLILNEGNEESMDLVKEINVDWKDKYEKLNNLKNTNIEKLHANLNLQIKDHLLAADSAIESQKKHVSVLQNEIDKLKDQLEKHKSLEQNFMNNEQVWTEKEKELEEKVLTLSNDLAHSKATVTTLQKQRRLSQASVDSVLREKIKVLEKLSGLKVIDVTNDDEGIYYRCEVNGKKGRFEFFLSYFDDNPTSVEYFPNFEAEPEETRGELLGIFPEFLRDSLIFETSSSTQFFYQIIDCLNQDSKVLADVFRINVISSPNSIETPINTFDETTFYHITHEDLWLCIASRNNPDVAFIFEFLYKFIEVCFSYFGRVNHNSIKDNFVLIYELLDEMIDFGYVQNTEFQNLLLSTPAEDIKLNNNVIEPQKITAQKTSSVAWRNSNVVYKKNQAFIDIVESLNVLVSAQGTVTKAEIEGRILMKSYLSGMPDCRLGLNEKLVMTKTNAKNDSVEDAKVVNIVDCQFHQCVRLNQFDQNRSISFIPPDGQFELMRYRTGNDIVPPFMVYPVISEITNKNKLVDIQVMIRSQFGPKLAATNVSLRIPVPPNTNSCNISLHGGGKAKYSSEENIILWQLPRFPGQLDHTLNATIRLSQTDTNKPWSRPPISLNFKIPNLAPSRLQVRFLQIQESGNFKSVKWVRYLTNAGSYLIRVSSLYILTIKLS